MTPPGKPAAQARLPAARRAAAPVRELLPWPPAGGPTGCLPIGGVPLRERRPPLSAAASAGTGKAAAPWRLLWVNAAGVAPQSAERLCRELPADLHAAAAVQAHRLLAMQRWDLLLVEPSAAGSLPAAAEADPPRRILALPAARILDHLALAAGFDGLFALDRPMPAGASIRLGARGYFVLPGRLAPAGAEGRPGAPAAAWPLLSVLRRLAELSERDRLLARHLAAGASNEAIAAALDLTLAATKARVRGLLGRLGLRNRTHAAVALTRCAALVALGWGRGCRSTGSPAEDLLR